MKRTPVIYPFLAVTGAILLFVVYYLYLGSTVPAGQQPLVRLNASNFDSLKESFNESRGSVRVMVGL
jgi:hypothetical protein